MQLFLYEFVTGGGAWHWDEADPPRGSLLAEGRTMVQAAADDLTRAGHTVTALLDQRLARQLALPCRTLLVGSAAEERTAFDRQVQSAEGVILIAPELGGALLDRCRRAAALGGRLLSPAADFVALAADKHATAHWLARRGIPVPSGVRLAEGTACGVDVPFPAVLKPCDGAGSHLVQPVRDRSQLEELLAADDYLRELKRANLRLEPFIPGQAASVAVLTGGQALIPLPPCEQLLANGGFGYLGGRLPLAGNVAQRAQRLALAALAAMPPTCGYVGIDMVLGAATDGSADYVIEVNPRLTTSYVGLRALCRGNLAAAMVEAACGQQPELWWHDMEVEFRADGTVVSGTRP